MASRQLIVELVGDSRRLEKTFKQAGEDTSRFGNKFDKVAKGAGIAAAGIGAGIAFGLKKAIDSANEHAQAMAQTQAVLKSTGGVANVTAKQIASAADAIEKKSGLDDLAVQSGENLLATFTSIRNEAGKGNDIFSQTTKIMADMSVALGQDTKSSALQLGKALNNPIKGVTALQRVGVAFTQGQKDQIKALVDSGRTMDAQKLILRELNKEFGGSAEAAGKTFPGQLKILQARLDDVAQRIGEKLVPALTRIVDWVSKHWPEISKTVETAFQAIDDAWVALQPTFAALLEFARRTVAFIKENWPQISATIKSVADTIKAVWGAVGPTLTVVIRNAVRAIKPLIESIAQVVKGIVDLVAGLLHGDWARAWEGFKNVVGGAIKGVKTLLELAVKELAVLGKAMGLAFLHALTNALKGLGKLLLRLILLPINGIIDLINKLKIPAIKVDTHIPKVGKISTPAFDPIPHIPRLATSAARHTTNVSADVKVFIDGAEHRPRRVEVRTTPHGQTRGRNPGVPTSIGSFVTP